MSIQDREYKAIQITRDEYEELYDQKFVMDGLYYKLVRIPLVGDIISTAEGLCEVAYIHENNIYLKNTLNHIFLCSTDQIQ